MDAITLLDHDHQVLRNLFARHRSLVEAHADPAQKAELAERICFEISLLAQIEEEIVYPALRAPCDGGHADAMERVEEIWQTPSSDARYDAMIGRLGESFERHIDDVRTEVYPKARGTLDLVALGAALFERKHALVRDAGRDSREFSAQEARTR